MKSLQSINFKNKKALIRVDFNVPLNAQFQVTDSTRIVSAKPTIMKVLEDGGSCVLMSHLGRPESKESAFSLKHIVRTLETVLGVEVLFSSSCIGEDAQKFCDNLKPGQILLLENLRYHSDETRGSENFAKELSKLGDFYINDAFGTAHRAHASTTIIAKFFPENRCFGSLLAQEIESIDKVMQTGEKPVLAILGGAKVSSKITIIDNILNKVDHLIIGGGMTFTFVKAQGGSVGDSICEDDKMELALQILERAKAKNVQVHIPVDVLAADEFSNHANTQIVDVRRIPENWQGLDCGPKSKALFHEVVQQCKTILWNGPLGVFEMEKFSTGTIALGNSIAEATKNGAFSLVGGGDSVSAVKQFGFENKVSYVSTGGGAMLESLEGKILPGIAAFSK
ncbi:MAG: phosphoglycerate kinase [Formosa sp.]|jgi:phosphoglycerate kinase|nr:phosphoglycerate kinase [Formosa sp.]MDA9646719.1 phosphoglycerate kinase [Flavobacteriaceae bacterium]MDC3198507.1 phosphoglycerate kinase [Flavobacteriaceae bacterium]